jgi:hypothetical protein
MSNTFQLYVKNTSNCEGLPLQSFERLSEKYINDSVVIPFGEDERRILEVVGWTDLYFGQACQVHIARVRWLPHKRPDISGGPDVAITGFMVWGGNSGVRILDPGAEPIEGVDDHLPRGCGRPLIWIEDLTDLPDAVQKVVTIPICQGCGRPLPCSTSPYHAGGKGEGVYLCPDCADPQTVIDYLARAKADLAALERGELATLVGWGVKDLREVGSGDVDSNQ